jgi:hypothetical protein
MAKDKKNNKKKTKKNNTMVKPKAKPKVKPKVKPTTLTRRADHNINIHVGRKGGTNERRNHEPAKAKGPDMTHMAMLMAMSRGGGGPVYIPQQAQQQQPIDYDRIANRTYHQIHDASRPAPTPIASRAPIRSPAPAPIRAPAPIQVPAPASIRVVDDDGPPRYEDHFTPEQSRNPPNSHERHIDEKPPRGPITQPGIIDEKPPGGYSHAGPAHPKSHGSDRSSRQSVTDSDSISYGEAIPPKTSPKEPRSSVSTGGPAKDVGKAPIEAPPLSETFEPTAQHRQLPQVPTVAEKKRWKKWQRPY